MEHYRSAPLNFLVLTSVLGWGWWRVSALRASWDGTAFILVVYPAVALIVAAVVWLWWNQPIQIRLF